MSCVFYFCIALVNSAVCKFCDTTAKPDLLPTGGGGGGGSDDDSEVDVSDVDSDSD